MNSSDLLGKARQLAASVVELARNGAQREAIIFRLVVEGLSLSKITSLRISDLVAVGEKVVVVASAAPDGSIFDGLCVSKGGDSLMDEILGYVDKTQMLRIDEDDLSRPFFPSRKGGLAITPRSAQRNLLEAQTACDLSITLSFREAARFGRSLRKLWIDYGNDRERKLLLTLENLDPLFGRFFSKGLL